MIWYCRRCDLGFCDQHTNMHVGNEGHELVEWKDGGTPGGQPFCAVCTGLYTPPPMRKTDDQEQIREA